MSRVISRHQGYSAHYLSEIVAFRCLTVALRSPCNRGLKVSLSPLMDHPPPTKESMADERIIAILAIHGVAIRPRLSRASGHLRRAVGRSELRILLSQPELVHSAQEQRKDHGAPAGRRLRHQLLGAPFAIWGDRTRPCDIPGACDRSLQQAEPRQFRISSGLGRPAR